MSNASKVDDKASARDPSIKALRREFGDANRCSSGPRGKPATSSRLARANSEHIFTDGHAGYVGMATATRPTTASNTSAWSGYGASHTNTIEGVWSLLERSIHWGFLPPPPRCLGEMEWRYNNRNNPSIFRETLRVLVTADLLTYRELVD